MLKKLVVASALAFVNDNLNILPLTSGIEARLKVGSVHRNEEFNHVCP